MNATQKKERLYGQLASGFALLKQHTARTTDLMEDVQTDLDAIRTFSGMHAAQCVHAFPTVLKTSNIDFNEDS